MTLVPIMILVCTVTLTVMLVGILRSRVGSEWGMSRRSLVLLGERNLKMQELMPIGNQIWGRQDGQNATIYYDANSKALPISGYDSVPPNALGKVIAVDRLKQYCNDRGIQLTLFPRAADPNQATVVKTAESQAALETVLAQNKATGANANKTNPAVTVPARTDDALTKAQVQEIKIDPRAADQAGKVIEEVEVMDKALEYMKVLFAKKSVVTDDAIMNEVRAEIVSVGTFIMHLWPDMSEDLQALKQDEIKEKFTL